MKKTTFLLIILAAGLITLFFFLAQRQSDHFVDPVPENKNMIPKENKNMIDPKEDKNTTIPPDNKQEEKKKDTEKKPEDMPLSVSKETETQQALVSENDILIRTYLSKEQQDETHETSFSGSAPEVMPNKEYSVSFSGTEFPVPSLGNALPRYNIDRSKGLAEKYVTDLQEKLNITQGTPMRSDTNKYSILDLDKGGVLLTYDILENTFGAYDLNISIGSANNASSFLEENDLLGFEYTQREYFNDKTNSTWVRFTPKLEANILVGLISKNSLTGDVGQQGIFTTAEGEKFHAGIRGNVDVEVDSEGNIRQIYHLFPNISFDEQVEILSPSTLSSHISTGKFTRGIVEPIHPGVLYPEQKEAFYASINTDTVDIENAKVSEVECGYFLKEEGRFQHFLSPACVVAGSGELSEGGHEAVFRFLLPITE